jgi:RNA polymerase sigma-70 factor, ECF subfamily
LNASPPQVLEIRQQFEAACASLRPDLHRFCTRMTGTVSDGEDLLQEALVHAFYHLPELREGAALRPWLFRIAHNCCIDWQRRRKPHVPLDDEQSPSTGPDVWLDLEQQQLAQTALAAIFTELPPRERASVVLKDVLGYSVEETAEITATSTGAVKAAVHRARQKLERAIESHRPRRISEHQRRVIDEYLARFNARDWPGVQALLSDDAQLQVMQRTAGPFSGQYFGNYAKLGWEWRIAWAEVEGSPMLVHFRRSGDDWQPLAVVELTIEAGKIARVRDYVHVAGLLQGARIRL